MALESQQQFGNILQRFNELPNSRKVGLLAALAATVSLIVGLFLWSSAPEYKVLFSNLSEKDGGSVLTTLQQMNVPYKMEAGGTIMVPADQVYDLRFRLASQGLPKGGAVGFELMDNAKLGMTQFQEQVAYQRALEGELARTIQTLAPVEAARVHLAIPKPSVFIRDQQKPSASVLVNLYAGRSLDQGQVSSIVHLVSSSVPELNADNITVVDQAGNLMTAKEAVGGMNRLNSSQLDFAREMELDLSKRIEAIVDPIVGKGNVKAEVRADLDFSESEYTSEAYKPNPTPETQAVRSRQTLSDTNAGAAAGGIPGAFTNQPPGPATAPVTAPPGANAGTAEAGLGAGGSNREENTTNFELDKTIRHVKEPLGRIKRLSVAVVVNYRLSAAAPVEGEAEAPAEPKPTPLNAQELEQINNLVKEAMGFNPARGDTVNVVNAAFTESKPDGLDLPLWKDPENIKLAKELLKSLLIFGLAFYLVFGVLRPLLRDLVRPMETAVTPEGAAMGLGLGEEGDESLEGLSEEEKAVVDTYRELLRVVKEFAKENPQITADVLKEWMANE